MTHEQPLEAINGPQFRMLRIVSGAVLNAAHHHPGHPVDRKFARGVAKRAVGVLTVQWPEVLTAVATAARRGAIRFGFAPQRGSLEQASWGPDR